MKITNIVVDLKRVVTTSSGTCLFLGNAQKTFIVYVDAVMGEQIRFAFTKQTQPRPLTSDFIKYILRGFDISVQNIVLYHSENGTFFSKIICQQAGPCTRIVEMDVRPSDAILLSLTMNMPLVIDPELLESLKDTTALLNNFSQIEP